MYRPSMGAAQPMAFAWSEQFSRHTGCASYWLAKAITPQPSTHLETLDRKLQLRSREHLPQKLGIDSLYTSRHTCQPNQCCRALGGRKGHRCTRHAILKTRTNFPVTPELAASRPQPGCPLVRGFCAGVPRSGHLQGPRALSFGRICWGMVDGATRYDVRSSQALIVLTNRCQEHSAQSPGN